MMGHLPTNGARGCGRIVPALSCYACDTLEAEDARRVRFHLDFCAACREALDTIVKHRASTGRTSAAA